LKVTDGLKSTIRGLKNGAIGAKKKGSFAIVLTKPAMRGCGGKKRVDEIL
jgi:hypothetical protein